MRNKKWLSMGLVFLFFVGAGIYYVSYGLPWDAYQYKSQFETYLEDKYAKDMEIEKISFDVIHQVYHATAYETSESELTFYVGQHITDKEISDSYDFEKLSKALENDIQAILNEFLSNYEKYSTELIDVDTKKTELLIWTEEEIHKNTQNVIKDQIRPN